MTNSPLPDIRNSGTTTPSGGTTTSGAGSADFRPGETATSRRAPTRTASGGDFFANLPLRPREQRGHPAHAQRADRLGEPEALREVVRDTQHRLDGQAVEALREYGCKATRRRRFPRRRRVEVNEPIVDFDENEHR